MARVSTLRIPALHNAMWPGLVGKGSPGAEPTIDLDTMLDLTASAIVAGTRFDGVDLFLFDPHVEHRRRRRRSEAAARQARQPRPRRRLAGRPGVAADRRRRSHGKRGGTRRSFVTQVRKACVIGRKAARSRYPAVRRHSHRLGIESRRMGRRIPRATPGGSPTRSGRPATSPRSYGERLAAEGEICWGGMHSWRRMVQLLEMVNRPKTLGYQADMAHNLLFTLGYNAPEDRLLPEGYDWQDQALLDEAYRTVARRCDRGRSIFMSRRTTRRSRDPVRTTRPAVTACPTIPTASSTSSVMRASGCVTTPATPDACACSTSAGTAACSRTTTMLKQRDVERRPESDDRCQRNAHGWDAPVAVAV